VFPPPTKPESGDQPSTRHKWKTQKTDYDIETNAESTLVAVLLASIGPTNELILEQGGTDLLDVSALDICTVMITAYGQMTLTDLAKIRLPLTTPLTSSINFLAHANTTRLIHAQLAEEKAPYLEIDQYTLFLSTLTNLVELGAYNIQYDMQYPDMQDKSFTTYVKFIVTHLPAIQAKSAANPFVGALAHDETQSGKTNRKKSRSEKTHEKTIAALTAQLANLTSSNPTQQTQHSKPPTSYTPSPITPAHMYCYYHGHSLSHGKHATGAQVGGGVQEDAPQPHRLHPCDDRRTLSHTMPWGEHLLAHIIIAP
jgi:hypothetical protein